VAARVSTTVGDPWAGVVGQDRAVAQLRAAVANPAHAYLFVGPAGSGRRIAARAFAGELLAAGTDPDAAARHRHLAATEQHPDLMVVERRGASIPVGDRDHPEEGSARWVVQRAPLTPVDAARSVWVLLDFHLVRDAAPVLLKTIEEPPGHVVFIVVADEVTPELVTIASRCVQVEFHAVSRDAIVRALIHEGAAPDVAEAAAAGSLGSVDRARLLVSDARFGLRRQAWMAVPDQLDGTGATAARLAAELVAMIDDAQAPLDERHKTELDELASRVAVTGERGSGRRELEARQRRETRRLRTDELRFGFTMLAERYREDMAGGGDPRQAVAAIAMLSAASEALDRNPNESLLLQGLMVRLDRGRR
jgi:DNA polymerase III subunit delta'